MHGFVTSGSLRETPSTAIRRVLLATDLSSASELATVWAMDLARRCDAELLVLSVIDELGPAAHAVPLRSRHRARIERDRRARAVVERGRRCGVPVVSLVWTGDPAESIVDAAEAEDVDVIVVGARDRSTRRDRELGSVSQRVIHDASRPVLVVRAPSKRRR